MPRSLAIGAVKVGFLAVAPTDPTAIKLTELTAGKDFSDNILKSGYNLGATGADKVSEPSLKSKSNATVPGASNYAGDVTFFRYLDATGKSLPAEDLPYVTFTGKGVRGWFVERVGPDSGAAWAVGDIVNVYEVIADDPQPPKDYTGYVKFVQPFHVQNAYLRVALVA